MDHSDESRDSGLGNEVIIAEYDIEKILAKRRVKGHKQYLIKFAHYDNSFNEWIPIEDVDEEAVLQFERESEERWNNKMIKRATALKRHKERKEQKKQRKAMLKAKNGIKKDPFRKKVASYIYHAQKTEEGVFYYVKWNIGGMARLHSSIVSKKIPELVIKFYEEIPWDKPENSTSTDA